MRLNPNGTPLPLRSIVDQVQQFHEILAPKPPGAKWDSSNSLFAFWIGINDIGNSYYLGGDRDAYV